MFKENKATKLLLKRKLIFLCFSKRGEKNKTKETKQDKNKIKRLEVKDSPCGNLLVPHGARNCWR